VNEEESAGGDTGELVVALSTWGTEASLPWLGSQAEQPLWAAVYDFLLYRDPETQELEPGLATEWSHSDDFTEWTFTLRQGVEFHRGYGEFTSADVKFEIEQNLDPEATGGGADFLRQHLEAVETPDPYTVVLRMKEPNWQIPHEFAQITGYHYMTSKAYVEEVGEEEANRRPVGTGSYQYVDGQQGSSHRFEAVEDHWRLTPAFDELLIRKIEDPTTALSALQRGEVDIIPVSGDDIQQAESAGLRILENPNAAMTWVVLPGLTIPEDPDYCPECPWAGDPADPAAQERARMVREALALAVDKQAVIDAVFAGKGSLDPLGNWYWPWMPGFDESWTPLPYDPERAQALLAEAGYPDGFEINLTLFDPPSDAITEAVAQYWEEIGVRVNLSRREFGTMLTAMRARDTDTSGFAYLPPGGYPEMSVVAARSATPGGVFCFVGCTEANGEKIGQIVTTTDEQARAELTRELQQFWYDERYTVNIAWRSAVWAVSDKVGEWPLVDGYRFEVNYADITPST
jgi:peptide/nickel transport system substrate-binding protein